MPESDDNNAVGTGRNSTEILAEMRSRIVSGAARPGSFLPTVRQLGLEYGVSRGTAWRALKALAAEGLVISQPRHGYRVLGSSTGPGQGLSLAYVLSRSKVASGWNAYYSSLGRAIEKAAAKRGWKTLKIITDTGREDDLFKQLASTRAWGLILDSADETLFKRTREFNLPAVLLDIWNPGSGFDAVVQDCFNGARLAVRELLKRGCRRIAWFGPIEPDYQGHHRFGGAAFALAEEELQFSDVHRLDHGVQDILARARALLESPERADGILTLSRRALQAVYTTALLLGLKVGKDFQLIGWSASEIYDEFYGAIFGNSPAPPVVVWSARQMAEQAVARLVERWANPAMTEATITVPTGMRY